MSLNKYMHPRNPYLRKKPDFKELAIKFDFFREHVTSTLTGKCMLDFRRPEALRALLRALLKDDFGLELDIPVTRLIPTLPLRINYLLWIQDVLEVVKPEMAPQSFLGVDIGAGSSCIYSLLGSKFFNLDFLALEVDDVSFDYAVKNVALNSLTSRIRVARASVDEPFHVALSRSLVPSDSDRALFVMCNPPFFADTCDLQAVFSTRKDERPQPWSVSSAADVEAITLGGEVGFVRRLIESSLVLRDRVAVYTTMLGKKSSISPLKIFLQSHGVRNIGLYEFCQGRTMRWGLCWVVPSASEPAASATEKERLHFPVSPFQTERKNAKPVKFAVPKRSEAEHKVSLVAWRVQALLDELDAEHEETSSSVDAVVIRARAFERSWANQRRKRREKMRETKRMALKRRANDDAGDVAMETASPEKDDGNRGADAVGGTEDRAACKRLKVDDEDEGFVGGDDADTTDTPMDRSQSDVDSLSPASATSRASGAENNGSPTEVNADVDGGILEDGCGFEPADEDQEKKNKQKTPVLDTVITISRQNAQEITIDLSWDPGQDRDNLYQVLQFFKNRFNR